MENNNNDKGYVDAAEILDNTANFVTNNWDKVILVSERNTEDGGKEMAFRTSEDGRRKLTESVREVRDEEDRRLVSVNETADGFRLTVGGTFLKHPRYGKTVWEVVDNIIN